MNKLKYGIYALILIGMMFTIKTLLKPVRIDPHASEGIVEVTSKDFKSKTIKYLEKKHYNRDTRGDSTIDTDIVVNKDVKRGDKINVKLKIKPNRAKLSKHNISLIAYGSSVLGGYSYELFNIGDFSFNVGHAFLFPFISLGYSFNPNSTLMLGTNGQLPILGIGARL